MFIIKENGEICLTETIRKTKTYVESQKLITGQCFHTMNLKNESQVC